jgi:hypothetical protein
VLSAARVAANLKRPAAQPEGEVEPEPEPEPEVIERRRLSG